MDTALSREHWAAEEQVRRKAAMALARKARVNLGSRDEARNMFITIKSLFSELRDNYDHNMSFDTHADYREPSIPNLLSGEYHHPLISLPENKKLKRLCKALWSYSNAQYNPENACRDLVDKCILCLDGAVEWPPTIPAPPFPKPDQRIASLKPVLGSHKQELSGLKGSVVDVIRHAVNDRLIERAMAKDDKSSRKLIPKERREVMKRQEFKSYGQSFDEDDEYESSGSSSSSSSSSDGGESGSDSDDDSGDNSDDSDMSSSYSQDSDTTADPFAGQIDRHDSKIDISIVDHAKRLLLRPRKLRERRPKPDVDAHHSVMGTTALIAACQFEDIPIEQSSSMRSRVSTTHSSSMRLDNEAMSFTDGERDVDSWNGAATRHEASVDSVTTGSSRGGRISRGNRKISSANLKFPPLSAPPKTNIRRSGKSVASTLMKLGTDVNLVGQEGMAALHAAAAQGNMNTLKRLIQSGAHRGVRDKYGRRADQVIVDELPNEKREAFMLLLRDLPTPPPPCRLLTAMPTSVELTWNTIENYPGEYELISHRLSLRITVPQAVSPRWADAVKSLSKELVSRTESEEGIKVRGRVVQGAKARHFYLPLPPTSTSSSLASAFMNNNNDNPQSSTSNSGVFFPSIHNSLSSPFHGSEFSNPSEPSSPLTPFSPFTPLTANAQAPSRGGGWNRSENPISQETDTRHHRDHHHHHHHHHHHSSHHHHHSNHSHHHHHSHSHHSSHSKHHHGHHQKEPHACITNDKGSIIMNEHGEYVFVEHFSEGSCITEEEAIKGEEQQLGVVDNSKSGASSSSMMENSKGLIVKFGAPPVTLTGLVPYTTYGLRLSSESRVGVSLPSLETLVFTKGEVPTPCGTPFQVGMTRTSITIMWIPPEYNNGSPVEVYEVRRFLPENPTSEQLEEIDKPDKFFPHLGTSTRYRIDGEENYTQIKFRELYPSARFTVRAKNAIGWSPFSVLSPAFSAGDSIRIVELGGTYIKIEWDTPPGLNILRFGLQKRFYTFILKEDQYQEVDDDIIPKLDGTPVRYTITGLKPGSKHQIRIRSSDTSGWRPWKTALVSEVMQCACDVPFAPESVVAALHYTGGKLPANTKKEAEKKLLELHSSSTTISQKSTSEDSIGENSVSSNGSEVEITTNGDEVMSVSFQDIQDAPSISLKWEPGESNGSPIEEYEVSWSNGVSVASDEGESQHDKQHGKHHGKQTQERVNSSGDSSAHSSHSVELDGLRWRRMALTKAAKYVAQEVILGGSYQFRVRARNDHGWSEYSEVSNSLTVFRVLPPLAPEKLQDEMTGQDIPPGVTFLRLSWKPPPGKPASEIDSYEMQFLDEKGSSSSSSNPTITANREDSSSLKTTAIMKEKEGGGASSSSSGLNWQPISIVGGPLTIKGAGIENPSQIMQGLLPGHKYRFRIRALAFEGWTDWSVPSEVMSTDRRF